MTKTNENIQCQMFVTQEGSAKDKNCHDKGMDIIEGLISYHTTQSMHTEHRSLDNYFKLV